MMLLRQMLGMGKKKKKEDDVPLTTLPPYRFGEKEGREIMEQAPNPYTGANSPESGTYPGIDEASKRQVEASQPGAGDEAQAYSAGQSNLNMNQMVQLLMMLLFQKNQSGDRGLFG